MITFNQALIANQFYHLTEVNADKTPVRVRRTGRTQTWKTRPGQFKIPVKYGLKESLYITNDNAHAWAVSTGDNEADRVAAILQRNS
jgi:hypothetical protein